MSNFREFLQTLRAKNDLVEVIGSYIKLERRGSNYWACCPFHHEKTPSFSVNAPDSYYHCFGCGASGDVIKFVAEYENIEFMQAVQILAKRAGLELPAFDDDRGEKNAEFKAKRDRLVNIMRDTARFYLNNLYSGKAGEYLEYIAGRGIRPTTAKRFGLGASLDYYSLPDYLHSKGYSLDECAECGALTKTDNRYIDSLGTRLIFPIINNLDDVIAFGGRKLNKATHGVERKYKNTKDTILFNKSKTVYNINLVKRERKERGIQSLIMVEGYMDAISLYEAGFHNVVASMGTSLTKEQARLCRRYSERVFISYDGDFAGQSANLRGLSLLKDEGIRVRVVPMPEGADPDDVIRKSGAEGYQACLDKAIPLLDFRLKSALNGYEKAASDERAKLMQNALAVLKDAESAAEREELTKQAMAITGLTRESIEEDLKGSPAPQPEKAEKKPQKKEPAVEKKALYFVLAACLFSLPYAKGYAVERIETDDGELAALIDYLAEGRAAGEVKANGIFDLEEITSATANAIFDLEGEVKAKGSQKFFTDSVRTIERKMYKEKIARAQEAYRTAETEEEKKQILACIGDWTKRMAKS